MSRGNALNKKLSDITMNEVLHLWEEGCASSIQKHPANFMLHGFIKGTLSDAEREDTLEHISYCPQCREHLWQIKRFVSGKGVIDYSFRKAAASQELTSFSVLTESGKCRIVFSRMKGQAGKGVVNLKVEPRYQKEMEGRPLVVEDKHGKQLLRGRVISGETPGSIVNADEVDWEAILVREDDTNS